MSETLIKIEGVSKKFCKSLKKSLLYGMQDLTREVTGRKHGGNGELRKDEFWAVNDVSFELRRGECLGLIGHNGAGKTTLLRMLNGLIKPDSGKIEMHGKIGALIALGAGFNPVLTGRENIYINASVLGLTKKEIDSKLDEVVDFAEINEFIDAPVQTYSSGMNVRLGFAVAAVMIEPDILFLDEVLAVGDIGFTIKCLNVVRKLTQKAAVVFVSHNMQFISSFSTRVMLMERGNIKIDTTSVSEGIDQYYTMISQDINITGRGGVSVENYHISVDDQVVMSDEPVIPSGSEMSVSFEIKIGDDISGVFLTLYVHDETLAPLICYPLKTETGQQLSLSSGKHNIKVALGKVDYNAGKYSFVIAVVDRSSFDVLLRIQGLVPFSVSNEKKYWGHIVRPAIPEIRNIV
jgi:lipopolysaccharide transport system ATP-binding protein